MYTYVYIHVCVCICIYIERENIDISISHTCIYIYRERERKRERERERERSLPAAPLGAAAVLEGPAVGPPVGQGHLDFDFGHILLVSSCVSIFCRESDSSGRAYQVKNKFTGWPPLLTFTLARVT